MTSSRVSTSMVRAAGPTDRPNDRRNQSISIETNEKWFLERCEAKNVEEQFVTSWLKLGFFSSGIILKNDLFIGLDWTTERLKTRATTTMVSWSDATTTYSIECAGGCSFIIILSFLFSLLLQLNVVGLGRKRHTLSHQLDDNHINSGCRVQTRSI